LIPYRVLDHDADILLEVYGASREELFNNAARALTSFIADPEGIVPSSVKEVVVTGNGELLVNFLNEIIYIWETQRFIPADVSITFNSQGLTATMRGETFDRARHIIKEELKAVTYHKFSIIEENGMFRATILIDV